MSMLTLYWLLVALVVLALIVVLPSIRIIGPTQVGLARTCDRRHLIKVSREEIPNVDVVLSLRPPKLA
jgi:hypothetical protein